MRIRMCLNSCLRQCVFHWCSVTTSDNLLNNWYNIVAHARNRLTNKGQGCGKRIVVAQWHDVVMVMQMFVHESHVNYNFWMDAIDFCHFGWMQLQCVWIHLLTYLYACTRNVACVFAKCTPIGCCQFISHQCMNCCTDLVKPGHHVCVDANRNGMQWTSSFNQWHRSKQPREHKQMSMS